VTKGGKEPEYETKMHSLQEGAIDINRGFMTLSSDRLILKYLKRWVRIISYWSFLVGINKWSNSIKSMKR